MLKDERQQSQQDVDINHFVCTLGEAAAINDKHPHPWKTVNDFIDHQAEEFHVNPAVAFPTPSKDDAYVYGAAIYSFKGLKALSEIYALRLYNHMNKYGILTADTRTIALLCPSSSEFLITWLALMRLGYSVLLIAPQCQPSAIEYLCRQCETSVLVYGEDYHGLAERARNVASSLVLVSLSELDDLFDPCRHAATPGQAMKYEDLQIRKVSEHDVAYLHHTSGTSTGLPKPIPQSHRAAVGVLPTLTHDHDKSTFTTTPLYHGGIADCFRAWTSGALIWLFPGQAVPITTANILRCLEGIGSAEHREKLPRLRYFSSVPYVLQMMTAEAKGLEVLKDIEIVGVGGAALSQSVGDDLVGKGVNLISRFGSAECGFLMCSHRQYAIDKEWQYLRSKDSPYLNFEPQEDGLWELVIKPSWPHMAKRNRPDGSFATADLFEKHPKIASAWRYHSRADSQLTLATGKKFDPAPMESAMSSSPLLKDVLIFGNGEQYPGALLFPSLKANNMGEEEILQALWPEIEKMNSESQSHARLSENMLVVMPVEAPSLEKSSKGTIMRGPAEKRYATIIKEAYMKGLGDEAESDFLVAVSDTDVPNAVYEIIKDIIGNTDSIPRDGDFYSHGVDSIACMRIRTSLQNKLLPAKALKLPLNVVYDCGTIEKLSQYLLTLRQGGQFQKEDEIAQMMRLTIQFGHFGPGTVDHSNNGEVVLLTGATGALGAHILSQLRSSSRVLKIHCLVRAASLVAAKERVSKSLLARNKASLDEDPASKVICHPCKLSDPRLGLEHYYTNDSNENVNLYNDLASRTTVIIHAAWAVNFSMRLSSFVKDHIAGLHHLINFALASPKASPPHFIFCSSTASVMGPKITSPVPENISNDPLSASPLGYSRSKWVAETICDKAHTSTRMRNRISVLRIGQLCGDTQNGIWNMSEAWPLMLSSVKVTESLPDLNENLDWLPVDTAAAAVVEFALPDSGHDSMSGENSGGPPVFHIVNPNKQITWSDLLRWLKKLIPDFDIISPADWVKRLDNLDGDAANHPARKLLGLWKEAYASDDGQSSKRQIDFDMEKTKQAISTMRDIQPIREDQFEKFWAWIERESMAKQASG
ncbi:hypothetical protein ACLMJK_009288 [Lecanora helva]